MYKFFFESLFSEKNSNTFHIRLNIYSYAFINVPVHAMLCVI